LDKAAVEGYVTTLRLVIDSLNEHSDEDDPRRTVALAASVVAKRLTSVFDTGSDLRIPVKTDQGRMFEHDDFVNAISFEQLPEWMTAHLRAQDAFREGDLKIFYVGDSVCANAVLSGVLAGLDAQQSADSHFFHLLLYGSLYLVLARAEFIFLRAQVVFWLMVEDVLRPYFGIPPFEELAELMRALPPTFASDVLHILELDVTSIERHKHRALKESDHTALAITMLELQAQYVFTGGPHGEEEERSWTLMIEKE